MANFDTEFDRIEKSFEILSLEASSLYIKDDVTTVETITPLEFQREYVGPNIPVLIKGAVHHWPAVKKWSIQFFRENFGDKEVEISVTPNGYADSIATRHFINKRNKPDLKQYFVLPEERIMKMCDFIDILEKRKRPPGVFYLQQQNSNLTEHFEELLPDIDKEISWASETFNEKPDAVNLWIGDSMAVTSMHKDPYENIYCVVKGYKDFILHPPTDRPWIPYKKYPIGIYKEVEVGIFDILPHKTQDSMNPEESFSDSCSKPTTYLNQHEPASGHSTSVEHIPFTSSSTDEAEFTAPVVSSDKYAEDVSLGGFLKYLDNLDIDAEEKNKTKYLVDMYLSEKKFSKFESAGCQSFSNSVKDGRELEDEEETVNWISVDPLHPNFELYPLYRKARPVHVQVNAGDALYLPSYWFHHVRQSHACIAVNYWYNMRFDIKYAYYQMLESLVTN